MAGRPQARGRGAAGRRGGAGSLGVAHPETRSLGQYATSGVVFGRKTRVWYYNRLCLGGNGIKDLDPRMSVKVWLHG